MSLFDNSIFKNRIKRVSGRARRREGRVCTALLSPADSMSPLAISLPRAVGIPPSEGTQRASCAPARTHIGS